MAAKSEIAVRPFEKSDAFQCCQVIEINKENLGDLYDEEKLKNASEYNQYWVAEKADKVVGMIGLSDLQNGIGMIGTLCVHPDYQRQGIASKLLQHCIAEAEKASFRKLLLLTHEQNKPTMMLAIKNDFVPEGQLRDHYRDGEKAVVYLSYFFG